MKPICFIDIYICYLSTQHNVQSNTDYDDADSVNNVDGDTS